MNSMNIANTIFDDCWLHTINFVGYYITLSENINNHFIFSSHKKLYEYYYNSDDDFGFRLFEKIYDDNCIIKKFYIVNNKKLKKLTFEEFQKTKYGIKFLETYNKFTDEELNKFDFIYFDNLIVMKNKPIISNVTIDNAFGIKFNEESFKTNKVSKNDFLKVISK